MIAHDNGIDHVALGLVAYAALAAYGGLWFLQPARSLGRLAAWTSGVAVLFVASMPWMEEVAAESFTGHMVQHLLVIAVAAPLLVVAEPLRTALRSGVVPATAVGRRVGTLWRRSAPVVGPVAFVLVLFATHLTAIYDRALGERWIHELEHAAYLGSAVLLWSAVLGHGRAAAVARVGVAFGVGAAGSVLGIALLSASEPLIPTYERRLGVEDALADQRTAAAIMWIGGMVTTVPLLLIAVWRWASAEQRTAQRSEELAVRQRRAATPPAGQDPLRST